MSYLEQALLTLHEHCVHPYFYIFVVVKFEKNRASTQEIIKRIINYDGERAPIAWIDVNPTTTRSPRPRRSLVLFELVINKIHIEIMCIFYSVKALSYTTYKENAYIPKARIYSRSGCFNRFAKRGSLETNNHSPDLK